MFAERRNRRTRKKQTEKTAQDSRCTTFIATEREKTIGQEAQTARLFLRTNARPQEGEEARK
jgi:hypothetical protein